MPLNVQQTAETRDLLQRAVRCATTQQDVISEAAAWAEGSAVPWTLLERVCRSIRLTDPSPDGGPWLHRIVAGGGLALEAPPARARSPQLQARLATLQRRLDEKQYAAMVADVTVGERAARERAEAGFGTFRQQMGFGVHVAVMMGTFYAMGHVAGGALHPDPIYRVVGGLVGLIAALLLESALLILRTSFPPELEHQRRQRQRQQRQARRHEQGQPESASMTVSGESECAAKPDVSEVLNGILADPDVQPALVASPRAKKCQ